VVLKQKNMKASAKKNLHTVTATDRRSLAVVFFIAETLLFISHR
jgi:hypothetical protein